MDAKHAFWEEASRIAPEDALLATNTSGMLITEVAKLKPYYFIMRDKSLSSDNVADNFEQIFNAYSKDTIRRIL